MGDNETETGHCESDDRDGLQTGGPRPRSRATLLFAAVILAIFGLAGLGGAVSPWLDLVTHFAPVWGPAALLTGLLAIRRRVWPAATVAGIGLSACIGLMAPEMLAERSPRVAADSGERLRLVQFNLWRRNSDPARAVDFVLNSDADVVVLEEAVGGAGGIPAALAKAYPYRSQCQPCSTVLMSRWPLVRVGSHRALDGDPFVWAQVVMPSGALVPVIGVQLYRPTSPAFHASQRARLARLAREFDRRDLIIAGDLNLTPWSFALRHLDRLLGIERRTRAVPSWPANSWRAPRLTSPAPLLAIDHIYAGSAWRTVSVERGPWAGSDHLPVVVTLARKP